MFLNVGPRDDFYPMPSVNPCGMERSIGRPENNGNGAHGGARDGLVCERRGRLGRRQLVLIPEATVIKTSRDEGARGRSNVHSLERASERAEKRREDINYANCERGREGSLQYDCTNNQDAQSDLNPNIMSCDTKYVEQR